jgi:ABC-2 type transport system permease protein
VSTGKAPGDPAAPAVELRGLVKRYGQVAAVDGLSVTAARGEVTAILGPNGAGKTTTIEICEGYRRPDQGLVRVLGLDPARDARALRPRVGVMLQSGGIPPSVPAADYLKLLSSFHVNPIDPAQLLDLVGLTPVARTPYKRLSGGQQQRLSLAAAVIGRPELVFLDEPTAGMDPQARHATWDLIGQLRTAGVSVILTTHFMEEAERLCDFVAIIDHGQLVAADTPGGGRTGQRQPARRAAAGQRDEGIPGRPLRDRGARRGGPDAACHGDRLVRRAGRAGQQPADREPNAGGRIPRAHRKGPPHVSEGAVAQGHPAILFAPDPGAAPLGRMITAQATLETRTLLRNGEQLLLTLIIPLLLLTAFSLEPLINFGTGLSRIDFLTPGIIALAVMSTAFTSQAIATGFERRYGVLKRLGATPLSRGGLIAAKTTTVIGVELLQGVLILAVGLAIGWRPNASPAAILTAPLLILLGTAAFSGLALLMAGTLRAEATLAAANLVYILLLGVGGVVFPLTRFPAGARPVLELLPTGALSTGLRNVLQYGVAFPVGNTVTLAVWAAVAIALAARTFRWD